MRAGLKAAGTMAAVLCAALPAAAQVFEVGTDGGYSPLCASLPPMAHRSTATPYQTFIESAATRYNLSSEFLIAVIRQESGFNPAAVSPRGAIGLMQLMPATAAELGIDPFDPAANIYGGAAYLRRQLDRFDGRIDLALAAYNAGAGAVNRHGGVPPYAETQAYVARSLDRLSAKTDPQPTETCS